MKIFKIVLPVFLAVFLFYLLTAGGEDPFRRRVKIVVKVDNPISITVGYKAKDTEYKIDKHIKNVKKIYIPNKSKDLKISLKDGAASNIELLIEDKKVVVDASKSPILYENSDIHRGSRYFEKTYLCYIAIALFTVFFYFCDRYKERERNGKIMENINFLRIFFALYVSVEHGQTSFNFNIMPNGVMFAECFIIISGLFLFLTSKFETTNFIDYFRKRFVRLFPSFFVVCMIYLFVIHNYDLFSMIKKLLTVSLATPLPISRIWAIPFFFWANCLLFCILKFGKEKANFILGFCVYLFLYLYLSHNSILFYRRYYILLICLFMGYFIAVINNNFKLGNNKLVVNFFELWLFLFLIVGIFRKNVPVVADFEIVYYCFTMGMVYFFCQKKGIISNLFECKLFTILAKYSFAYYLIHEVVFDLFVRYNILSNLSSIYRCFVAIIVSSGMAYLLYHFVENPIANRLKAVKQK